MAFNILLLLLVTSLTLEETRGSGNECNERQAMKECIEVIEKLKTETTSPIVLFNTTTLEKACSKLAKGKTCEKYIKCSVYSEKAKDANWETTKAILEGHVCGEELTALESLIPCFKSKSVIAELLKCKDHYDWDEDKNTDQKKCVAENNLIKCMVNKVQAASECSANVQAAKNVVRSFHVHQHRKDVPETCKLTGDHTNCDDDSSVADSPGGESGGSLITCSYVESVFIPSLTLLLPALLARW